MISVIVPTFNRARSIERCLKSVIMQTFTDWELILVDNFSTDETGVILKKFTDARIKIFQFRNNGVVAASRNFGVSMSKGNYLAFLDSDDWWLPKKLEVSIKEILRGADLVYHDLRIVSTSPHFFQRRRFAKTRSLSGNFCADLLNNGNAIVNSSVVMRREVFERVGGFSPDKGLLAAEDYDLWLRISNNTEKFVRIKSSLGFYEVSDENLSSDELTKKSIRTLMRVHRERISTAGLRAPVWMLYTIAKILRKRKKRRSALLLLKISLGQWMPFNLRCKVLFLLLVCWAS